MAFEISSEQEMIRLMARDFAKKELEPMASEWERQSIFPMDAVKKWASSAAGDDGAA